MKNLLFSILLLSAGIANVNAAPEAQANDDLKTMKMMMDPQNIVNFAKAVRGKTITLNNDQLGEWFSLKANMFSLAAREFDALAGQIDDESVSMQYTNIADQLRALANDMREVQIPNQKLTKTIHMMPWLLLKARKAALMSESLKTFAAQIDDKDQKDMLLKKSEHLASWSAKLSSALKGSAVEAVRGKVQNVRSRIAERLAANEQAQERIGSLRERATERLAGNEQAQARAGALRGRIAERLANANDSATYIVAEGTPRGLVAEEVTVEGCDYEGGDQNEDYDDQENV